MEKSKEVAPLYDKISDWFDASRDKTLLEKKYLDRVIADAPAGGKVLDLGCGTGEPIARYFIERGFDLTGVDLSEKMIGLATQRFPGTVWFVEDMRTFSSRDTFDIIVAWDSFFHLDHDAQRKMFPLFKKHAAENAMLLFNTGAAHGEAWGKMQEYDFHHASLSPEEYKTLLADNGFIVAFFIKEDPEASGRTTWLAQRTTP